MSDAEQAAKQIVQDVLPLIRIGSPVLERWILAEVALRFDRSPRYSIMPSGNDERSPQLASADLHHRRECYDTIGEFLGEPTGRVRETLEGQGKLVVETHWDAMEIEIMQFVLNVCDQAARDLGIEMDDSGWFDEVLDYVSRDLDLRKTTEHQWLTYISDMPISALD